MRNCGFCQEELHQLAWNSTGDMIMCKNPACPRWHSPAGFIMFALENEDAINTYRREYEYPKGRGFNGF